MCPPEMGMGLYQSAQSPSCLRPTANTGRQIAKVEVGGEKTRNYLAHKGGEVNTRTGSRGRTRPNPHKSLQHKQNQPAQHCSAFAINPHRVVPAHHTSPHNSPRQDLGSTCHQILSLGSTCHQGVDQPESDTHSFC